MNQPLLVVISYSANDGVLAEHLSDFIFLINRRQQEGHCLLVVAGDVHDELRAKVKMAAQVAFTHVDQIDVPKTVDPNKNIHVNRAFQTACLHIAKTYRTPWLWLEPDCVPLKYGWLDEIAESHYSQAKRYSGPWKATMIEGRIGQVFLNRVAVYPPDAISDLEAPLKSNGQFNLLAGPVVHPKSTKTAVIEDVAITDEGTKLKAATVLVHGDKQGILMSNLREKFEQAASKKK